MTNTPTNQHIAKTCMVGFPMPDETTFLLLQTIIARITKALDNKDRRIAYLSSMIEELQQRFN